MTLTELVMPFCGFGIFFGTLVYIVTLIMEDHERKGRYDC